MEPGGVVGQLHRPGVGFRRRVQRTLVVGAVVVGSFLVGTVVVGTVVVGTVLERPQLVDRGLEVVAPMDTRPCQMGRTPADQEDNAP
jgi:uncharacterized membrane protein